MVLERDRLEVERIENLVVNFGWTVIKQEVVGNKLHLTLSRDAQVPDVELEPGSA